MEAPSLGQRAAVEFIGTAFLTLGIIGSGIAGSRLSDGDPSFTLLVNAVATGLVLVAIILAIGSISGGQLNPAVTLVAWMTGGLSRSEAGVYALAQLGAVLGAIAANVIFGLAAFDLSTHSRSGWELWTSEVLATFGLVLVIFGVVRSGRATAIPFAVGAISRPRSCSRHRWPSPIPLPQWLARSLTPSPGSPRHRYRCSCLPSSSVPRSV